MLSLLSILWPLLGLMCSTNVVAQTLSNPLFEQSTVLYSITPLAKGAAMNQTFDYSQDFQTVHAGSDANESIPSRALINLSLCCPSSNNTNTTLLSLGVSQNTISWLSTIPTVPKIALVKRGGCLWSSKVQLAAQLSSSNNMSIQAVLLYDNITQPDATYAVQYPQDDKITLPTYNTTLTPNRDISQMSDNDIGNVSTSANKTSMMPVYFAPNTYGADLLSLVSTANAANDNSTNGMVQVWQLTAHLSYFRSGSGDSSGDSDSSSSGDMTGYLSYGIALAAMLMLIIFAGLLFVRWWRVRQGRALRRDGVFPEGNNHTYPMRRVVATLPREVLDSFNVVPYSADTVKNASCAVCLDDFTETSQVRLLPCEHGFCVECIDPWLSKKSTVCPVCKHDYLPKELKRQSSELSESSEESSGMNTTNSTTGAIVIAMDTPESSTNEEEQAMTTTSTSHPDHSVPSESPVRAESSSNTAISLPDTESSALHEADQASPPSSSTHPTTISP